MILKWGAYAHDQDEVGIHIHRRSIFDKFNRRMGDVQDWHIIGAKQASSQAAITTALDSMKSAYDNDYRDLILYLNDGSTATHHSMTSDSTFGGTKVVHFNFPPGPWKMQTEYANRRTFHIVVRGETRTGTGQYSWKERVSIKGTGGPKFRYMPSLTGAPVSQTLQQQTTFFYVQEGHAVGRETYIVPPGPLYPGIEHQDMREIIYETPDDIRVGGQEMFHTRWKYVMEATASQGFSAFILPTVT